MNVFVIVEGSSSVRAQTTP